LSRFGIQVEKSISYRGATQPFSNTYYYEIAAANTPADNPGVIGVANDMLDDVVAAERAAHGTNVNFVMARCWSQIGTPSQNEMIVQRPLTGTGAVGSPPTSIDRERAFLVRFRAGSDSRGRPVYLRKWFHLDVSLIGGETITPGQLQQTAQLTTNQRNALQTLGNALKNITPGAGPVAELVSKQGRQITGATTAHPYFEHHQLGEAWRNT
jgi:hypothetical protein